MNTIKNVEKVLTKIKSENADYLKKLLKSEIVYEWIAAGIKIGGKIRQDEQEAKDLAEFIKNNVADISNLHLLRHSMLPLFIAHNAFDKTKIAISKNKDLEAKPTDLFSSILRYFEANGFIKYFENRIGQQNLNNVIQTIRATNDEIKSQKDALENRAKKLEGNKNAVKKYQELTDTLNSIEVDKFDKNVFENFIKPILQRRKISVDGKTVELKDFTEWIIGSALYGIPYVTNDFNLNWDIALLGITSLGLDSSGKQELIKPLPFILSKMQKQNLKVTTEFISKNLSRLFEKFIEEPMHLYEFYADIEYNLVNIAKILKKEDILKEIKPSKSTKPLDRESRLKRIFKEIKELAESGDYEKREVSILIFNAEKDSFEILNKAKLAGEKFANIVKLWGELLDFALEIDDKYLWLNVSRILKKIYQMELDTIKDLIKQNKIDANEYAKFPEIMRQLWRIRLLSSKWGISTKLMKDLGTLYANLIEFELEVRPKDKPPVILPILLSSYPESGILREASRYTSALSSFLEIIPELIISSSPPGNKFAKYFEYFKEIYNLDLSALDKLISDARLEDEIKEYIKGFIELKYALEKIHETHGELLSNEESKNFLLKIAGEYAAGKVHEFESQILELRNILGDLSRPGTSSESFIFILKSLVDLLREIDTQIFPPVESNYMREKIADEIEDKKQLLYMLEVGNEPQVIEKYEEAIRSSKTSNKDWHTGDAGEVDESHAYRGLNLFKVLEKWLFTRFFMDYILKKRAEGEIDPLKKLRYRSMRWALNPVIVFPVLFSLFFSFVISDEFGKLVLGSFISLALIAAGIFLIALIIKFLIQVFSSSSSPKSVKGVEDLQFFLPRFLTLLIIVAFTQITSEVVWGFWLDFTLIQLISVFILFVITYLFIYRYIDRRIEIEYKGESIKKRAFNMITLGFTESFVLTTLLMTVFNKILTTQIRNAPSGRKIAGLVKEPFLGIPKYIDDLKIPLSVRGTIEFSLFGVLAIAIQSLFIVMVIHTLLEREEIIE